MSKKTKETQNVQAMEQMFLKMVGGEDDFGDPFLDEDLGIDDSGDSALAGLIETPSEKAKKIEVGEAQKNVVAPTIDTPLDNFPKDLEIFVSDDGMQALLIGRNARPFEAPIIIREIKRRRIIQGVDLDVIYRTVSLFKETTEWNGRVIFARGEPATARETISFPFIEKKNLSGGEISWLVDGESLLFDTLKDIYDKDYMPSKEEAGALRVRGVDQGETVATVIKNEVASHGFNVFGNVITISEPLLVPGKNIKQNEQNGNYEAMIFGFIHIEGNTLSILPPLKIDPNQMAAYYLNLQQIGKKKYPDFNDLKYGLILKGINERAIQVKKIEALCDALKQEKVLPPLMKIASGVFPVNGVDAHFVHSLDLVKKAGVLRDDESIDLKERNIVQSVEKGTLIGQKILLKTGSPGVTIFGKKIRHVKGMDVDFTVKGPVRRIKKNDCYLYSAKQDGNVSFHNNTLILTDIYKVDGSVDYASGNINVTTGLVVTESVLSGFKVKSGGNTIIGGTLENGCSVYVDGDLEVGKGIIGENTKVFVMGSLRAEFIQDAEVMVKGDVNVSSYIFNGKVRAGGEIVVHKSASRRGGAVVGGIICATTGIELAIIGSPANVSTTVSIQRDFELVGKLNKLLSEIHTCTSTIAKMMRTIQIENLDGETIKRLLASVPAPKQELIIKILEHLNKFIKHRKNLADQEEDIQKRIQIRLKKAKIRVSDQVLAGNQIQIGDRNIYIKDDLGRVTFQLKDDEISY